MKILQLGKQMVVGERWWVGLNVTCPECDTVFKLDDTDPSFATDKAIGINCPNYTGGCRTHLSIKRDGTVAHIKSDYQGKMFTIQETASEKLEFVDLMPDGTTPRHEVLLAWDADGWHFVDYGEGRLTKTSVFDLLNNHPIAGPVYARLLQQGYLHDSAAQALLIWFMLREQNLREAAQKLGLRIVNNLP